MIDEAWSKTTGKCGALFYELTDGSVDGEHECYKWYFNEPDPRPAIEEAGLKCPCTFWQFFWDGR